MSVEPSAEPIGGWARWAGHVINGVYVLRRYIGGSDRSGVFLADIQGAPPSRVACKLIRADRGVTLSQLANLRTATGLVHPNLIQIFETGIYQFDGVHYVYAVMEHADQSLAQILGKGALSEDEAQDILAPTLSALAFLHAKHLVQGQLKPANILVVGERLKLASDTVHPVMDGGARSERSSIYAPPESGAGRYGCAGDIWGLGVCLREALARGPSAGAQTEAGSLVLPSELSASLRQMISACLSERPEDRPSAATLETWLAGRPPVARGPGAIPRPAPAETSGGGERSPNLVAQGIRAGSRARIEVLFQALSGWRAVALAASAVIAAVIVTRAGWRMFTHSVKPPVSALAVRSNPRPQTQGPVSIAATDHAATAGTPADGTKQMAPAPATGDPEGTKEPSPANATVATEGAKEAPPARAIVSTGDANRPAPASTPAPNVHEEIPKVPLSARQTIHGHVRVAVRVMVDDEGNVAAVLVDEAGPSRYFERLAVEAARKWTFPPPSTQAARLELIRFEFGRDGTTARASSVQ